ncbi:MAG: rRNA maturation RNase YbeY [Clostridiales bacterium]|nr:rRNA maturation RNase YbeY [Clostridiales bacterium]
MKIYFTNIGIHKFTIKRLLEGALNRLGQPAKDIEMSLSIVSPKDIQALNKQFRGIDAVTDVLSFPTIDNPERGVLDVNAFTPDAINGETGKLNIGDVIICIDRAKEQAAEYGHSLKRELCFLSLHGLLHLMGYDHVEPRDEQQMNALQEEILQQMGITRNK